MPPKTEIVLSCLAMLLPVAWLLFCKQNKKDKKVTDITSDSARDLFSRAHSRFNLYHQRIEGHLTNGKSLSVHGTEEFDHQVAGHTCEVLRRLKGCVLKPMVKGYLFLREVKLYEEMASRGTHVSCAGLPHALVPFYRGLCLVENDNHSIVEHQPQEIDQKVADKRNVKNTANKQSRRTPKRSSPVFRTKKSNHHQIQIYLSKVFSKLFDVVRTLYFQSDGLREGANIFVNDRTLPHLVLEDLTIGFRMPCAIDIKMGQHTYEPTASEDKKAREKIKCPYQEITGFRITGFKVYDVASNSFHSRDKFFGRRLTPDNVADGLSIFFHNGLYLRRDVIMATIEQLERIHTWMKSQTSLHFYCSSILVIYDGAVLDDVGLPSHSSFLKSLLHPDVRGKKLLPLQAGLTSSGADLVKVKMIDFAHTLPSSGGVDRGYLLGLRNLITCLHKILNDNI